MLKKQPLAASFGHEPEGSLGRKDVTSHDAKAGRNFVQCQLLAMVPLCISSLQTIIINSESIHNHIYNKYIYLNQKIDR